MAPRQQEKEGHWRWLIISPRSKKPLQVGSFYGPLPEAKRHAEAAVLRLKAHIQKNPSVVFSRPRSELTTRSKDLAK
jgi:hypothetical protein